MPTNGRDRSVLEHIISYCAEIEEAVQRFGDSYEAFREDSLYRHACAMCILQIGELTGHLSEDFRVDYDSKRYSGVKAFLSGRHTGTCEKLTP